MDEGDEIHRGEYSSHGVYYHHPDTNNVGVPIPLPDSTDLLIALQLWLLNQLFVQQGIIAIPSAEEPVEGLPVRNVRATK